MNVFELSKFAKYTQILNNSETSKETAGESMFLMKERAAVKKAMGLGAQPVEGGVASENTLLHDIS